MPEITDHKPADHEVPSDDGADDERTYNPPREVLNRAREQGAGVGQKDLNDQRDPTRAPSADQYGRSG